MAEALRTRVRVSGIQKEQRFYGEKARPVWRLSFDAGPGLNERGSLVLESLGEAQKVIIGGNYELVVTMTPEPGLFESAT